ncbi:uncharacterized protein LOC122529074 [Frieseomelitta varia]|uniref:uncharacterized protein LOC122529074 n=1 Tax=Frieseomelitta varia TaxID=561572 RepID=UPI001CB6B437|nr:uncharacterized protein LOC122529074 [Frieseomelitta varia]
MTSPRHADRFVDCPGPCNPRNRVCRRTCVQNVMSILDELPPCIRARICQEDLLAVLMKDQEIEQESVNPLPVEPTRETRPEPTQRPKKDLSTSSRYKPDNGKPERDKDADNPYPTEQMIGEGTQTMEEKHVQTTEQIVHEVTSRYRSVSAGTRSLRQRTEDASILARSIANTGIRGIRTLGSTRMPSCPCSLINTAVYVGLLLLLAIFARHSPTYQIFLSSQICGILAILSWKFSGRVPI